MRQFLHKKQCVTRKFHVLVAQNGIVVEKTNFGKKLGVRTQLPWQLQLKCFQISFRKSLCAWWSQLKVISLKLFYYQSFFETWYIALFPRQLEVLVLTQIHQIRNYFPKKNLVLLSNFFFFFKYVVYWTVLSKYLGKKSGVTVLASSQTAVNSGHGFGIAVRMDNCAAGTGARNKITPIVFDVCTRDQACYRLFLCV